MSSHLTKLHLNLLFLAIHVLKSLHEALELTLLLDKQTVAVLDGLRKRLIADKTFLKLGTHQACVFFAVLDFGCNSFTDFEPFLHLGIVFLVFDHVTQHDSVHVFLQFGVLFLL